MPGKGTSQGARVVNNAYELCICFYVQQMERYNHVRAINRFLRSIIFFYHQYFCRYNLQYPCKTKKRQVRWQLC